MNEYYNNKLVLCIGKNNCLLLGMPNNNKEHTSVTDRHIGTIINIRMSIYIYQITYKEELSLK